MISNECLSLIPPDLQKAPWLNSIINLLQEQTRVIQEQTRVIQEQAEQITILKKTVQDLKDEIARQKKMPKRPKFRPGGGDPKSRSGEPGNNSTTSGAANRITPQKIQQEVRVSVTNVPEGSRFKGYQTYIIQELEMTPKDITLKLEVWQLPDGSIIRAVLPIEARGSHFGHQLRALIHNLYSLGMTEPGLFDLLSGAGIEISEGQVHNILMNEADAYHKESEQILTAGMEEAPYIRTDDTGEKHRHKSV